jgi:hypothetical protein
MARWGLFQAGGVKRERTRLHHHLRRCAVDIFLES